MTVKVIKGKLLEVGNGIYKINHTRKFVPVSNISIQEVGECFEFSYEMAFGEGAHRKTRSGGEKKRSNGEIFIDTFQGKLSEFSVWKYLSKEGLVTQKPDTQVEGYGKWDSFDLEFQDKHMAIKSTKSYGNLLLLETSDWNCEGEYIPNIESGASVFDFFILVRICPDGEAELKKKKLLYSKIIDKQVLWEIIKNQEWRYDVAGYITQRDLIRIIDKKYILPKGSLLNGKIKMDAENYYVQAGDMRDGKQLLERLKEYKRRGDSFLSNH